jgi:hypothetical protein
MHFNYLLYKLCKFYGSDVKLSDLPVNKIPLDIHTYLWFRLLKCWDNNLTYEDFTSSNEKKWDELCEKYYMGEITYIE